MTERFHFLTRTWRTGYRFTPPERDSEERFYRQLKTAGIFGTEEPFAVIDGDCLIAGGMETAKRDKEGRTIRFSFMLEGDSAGRIFYGLASHWDEAEQVMRSCFDWESYRREDVVFAADEFLKALNEYGTDAEVSAPSKGRVLKWDKSGISAITPSTETKSSWPKILAVCAVMVMIIAGGLLLYPKDRKPETHAVPSKTELQEIYSGLRQALDAMREAYTYMSMIDDDAGLAVEYSRSKSDEAGKILDEVAVKLKSFDIEAGNL